MTVAKITTGSRLHFGPLSVAAPNGGAFGGIGMMISEPNLVLEGQIAQQDRVIAEPDSELRIVEFLRRIRMDSSEFVAPKFQLKLTRMIPTHNGFGSGTQLGLAVASVVSRLVGEVDLDSYVLATRAGRGLRSAIGLHGFCHGGFLIDGGRTDAGQLGTMVSRVEFPEHWRVLLATVNHSAGLSGEAEQSTFASQPAMPLSLTAELCRIVLMELLPALINQDFRKFGDSLFRYGHHVGEFFAPAQGGVFSNPRMAAWADQVRNRGIEGVAQTSWGPTVAAICPDENVAIQLQQDYANDPNWGDCRFTIVRGLNRGASVMLTDV